MLSLLSIHFFGAWNNVLTPSILDGSSYLVIHMSFLEETFLIEKRKRRTNRKEGERKEEGTDHKLNFKRDTSTTSS